ncbi:MAG TPA: aldo/keto reductase, partial [Acidimicrobiales bacterium]|nr:aldo/keto reductase [Acidimicrobiales bacterium]
PLARGLLTRDPGTSTDRSETDEFGRTLYACADAGVIEAVAKIAADRGVSRAQVALAWVSKHPAVTAPIFGATKMQQLEDAIASIHIELTADEITALESPYTPQPVQGFI